MRAAASDQLDRLRRFAYWMDEGIRLPGTRVRIGLDPILGLVPGVGDAAGAILSAAILVEAVRRRVTRFTFLRMAANVALDAMIGAVPVLGDIFDAAWKANSRNLSLLERSSAAPSEAASADRLFVLVVCGSLLLLSAAVVAGGVLFTLRILERLL